MEEHKVRLIDAEAFKRYIDCGHLRPPTEICFSEIDVVSMIDRQPTVDAVPVVRCKDCRYSEPMKKHGVCKFGENALNCTQCRGDNGYGYAGISVIYPDDYCSDGAPKDGETDATDRR